MEGTNKYTCSICGLEHDQWPSIAWDAPVQYYELSEQDKEELAQLSSDFCVINNTDGSMDRFIRCVLDQEVVSACEPLNYGVWVSLSQKSFEDYSAHYHDDDYEETYFGWLCTNIPEYESTVGIPTTVQTRAGGIRPIVVPHKDHPHPFVDDFYNGISLAEAEKRIFSATTAFRSRMTE